MAKLKVRRESKTYGFLRCSEETVPRLKSLSPRLGYPSIVAFLDAMSRKSLKDWKDFMSK